jgi:hypothetical protein
MICSLNSPKMRDFITNSLDVKKCARERESARLLRLLEDDRVEYPK